MVIIGVDSHKRTHTVVAVNDVGRRLGERTVRTNSDGHLDLVAWSAQFDDVAFVVDVFSRRIVGWRAARSMTTSLVLDEGIDPSVGSVGDALDNAMAETTVGSFKNELIHRQGPWRDVDQVELGTAEWVAWFNTERPHEHLDDLTPETVEKLHYAHRHPLPRAG